ncbi:MAG: hypothetical protein MMC23_008002 [Stictis urceolatum]|nr:hypothetical protein [Stictis urceolata]
MASLPNLPSMKTNYTAVFDAAQSHLGFDPTVLINISLILAAISTAIVYTGGATYRYASNFILSSAHINEDDVLYGYVMQWMGDKHISSKRFRSVKAKTSNQQSWGEEETAAESVDQEFDVNKLISYRAVISRAPIHLTPWQSKHIFRHRGHWLFFQHSLHKNNAIQFGGQQERGYVNVQCLGRSLEPVRRFLEDTQVHSLQKNMSTTIIFRALNNNRDQLRWHQVLSRPSRDIRTVILGKKVKNDLLTDINEYLHPKTRRWYANRGIPYRRGYLFSGAPGTGKTSLTAAIAGVFGLNIYVLSLLDPLLSEGQLNKLLSEVPNRCIVLLEDVDAAGLKRAGEPEKIAGDTKDKNKVSDKDDQLTAVAKAVGAGPAVKPTTDISLSGLLNAIDGVSSQEGRILVMTTNNPEDLDKALVRPGRVDMHIAFQLPKREEMRELFLSMYRDIMPASEAQQNGHAGDALPNDTATESNEKTGLLGGFIKTEKEAKKDPIQEGETHIGDLEFQTSAELQEMATNFASSLPEGELSLASIQGFLLRWKRDPRKACEEAAAWGKEALARQE